MRSIAAGVTPVLFILANPTLLSAECCSRIVCAANDSSVERSFRHGRWFVIETKNFQVCSVASEHHARSTAAWAEELRSALGSKWLGNTSTGVWNPKCQIVVHPDQNSYVTATGRGSQRTAGSSLVNVVRGRITSRRIDVLSGQPSIDLPALPHELTHVVLKDRFPTKALPHWADEGTAILADSKSKQDRHCGDLKEAIRSRTTFRAVSLLTLEGYPQPNQWGVFYAQSSSVVSFLVNRKTPEHFINFLEQASASGYDLALRSCYGIADAADLDLQWRRSTAELLKRS